MRGVVAIVVLLLAACGDWPVPEVVVIRASELIDGTGAKARSKVRITIRKGLVDAVSEDNDVPPPVGAQVIDARGLSVLPGFIATVATCPAEALREATQVHRAMVAGVTTAEVVSPDLGRTVALRTYVEGKRDRGPRIVVGATIAPGNLSGATLRAKVRAVAEAGSEMVHVPLLGDAPTARDPLCALVDEANAQDMHALIEVDTSEHFEEASACNAETIVWHGNGMPSIEPEPLREAAEVIIDADATSALAWEKASAMLAFSSNGDSSCILSSAHIGEVIAKLVAGGVKRENAIAAFTSGAARTLGLGDALGRIAPGYRADLLIAERGGTGTIRHVFIDGVEQSLSAPSLPMQWAAWWSLR